MSMFLVGQEHNVALCGQEPSRQPVAGRTQLMVGGTGGNQE